MSSEISPNQLDEERIFQLARRQPDLEARSEYLDQICAGDQGLRERVQALLEAHEQEASLLKSNNAFEPTEDHNPIQEFPGSQIGRYKLPQKIGKGGFGVVCMAEHSHPVRRKVALKISKPGMDTREWLEIFISVCRRVQHGPSSHRCLNQTLVRHFRMSTQTKAESY